MEFDMVSDLNDGTADFTIPAETGEVAHGKDAVSVNNQTPTRDTPQTAKIVGEAKAPSDKPASIRDLISGALKGETATPEAGLQDGRARDPVTGQFIEKTAEEIAALTLPAVPPVAAAPVGAPQGIDPAVFASLPAETQATLARTMDDVSNQQKRFASLAPIEQLITPRIQAWALNGMEPHQAMSQLLALSDFAGRDTVGFIKYIAQNNGVDLEDLVLGMAADEPVDPRYAALEKELSELRGTVQGQTQQQQQAAHDAVVNNVIAFAEENGPDGNVLRPHLSELGQSWLPYISMVKEQNPSWSHAQVMQQAYENACWSNPSVRSKLQATTSVAADADRLRAETARVEAARAASVSVKPGAPSTPPAAPDAANRNTRDVIRAAIALHS